MSSRPTTGSLLGSAYDILSPTETPTNTVQDNCNIFKTPCPPVQLNSAVPSTILTGMSRKIVGSSKGSDADFARKYFTYSKERKEMKCIVSS